LKLGPRLGHLLDRVRDRDVLGDPALRGGDGGVAVIGRRVEDAERRLAVAVPLEQLPGAGVRPAPEIPLRSRSILSIVLGMLSLRSRS
jgi:hypothetical protein